MGWEIVLVDDGFDWTFRDAVCAADALLRVDEHSQGAQLAFPRVERTNRVERKRTVDAIDRTDLDARGIACADAQLGDDVCHARVFAWRVPPPSHRETRSAAIMTPIYRCQANGISL